MNTINLLLTRMKVEALSNDNVRDGGVLGFINVLDALKFGSLGLAGIILLLAFDLYRQANKLPTADRIQRAHRGASNYMAVAKGILIPCMILQLIGIIVPMLTKATNFLDQPRKISARIRLPPLQAGNQILYGTPVFKIYHGDKMSDPQKLDDEEKNIEISPQDTIVVNIKDVIDRIDQYRSSQQIQSHELQPTALSY